MTKRQKLGTKAKIDKWDLIKLHSFCGKRNRKALRRLRQKNNLNLGSGGCSELRLCHCTPAWATEPDKERRKEGRKEGGREGEREPGESRQRSHGSPRDSFGRRGCLRPSASRCEYTEDGLAGPIPTRKTAMEALRTESFTAGAATPGRGNASAKGKLRNRKLHHQAERDPKWPRAQLGIVACEQSSGRRVADEYLMPTDWEIPGEEPRRCRRLFWPARRSRCGVSGLGGALLVAPVPSPQGEQQLEAEDWKQAEPEGPALWGRSPRRKTKKQKKLHHQQAGRPLRDPTQSGNYKTTVDKSTKMGRNQCKG
ncbi:hypothetical protein AAY473_040418 [Plecturocebus cupreus]